MNDMERGIVALIKAAITGEQQPLGQGFDLEQAFALIQKHGVLPLVYEGAVRCGISPQENSMRRMFSHYYKAIIVSERQRVAIEQLFASFDREKIQYMPLKGIRMKQLYPSAQMRLMGDADILICMDEYDRIKPLLLSLGYEEKQDTDHELVWKSESLYLELHKRLIPSYNKDFYTYYGDGWKLARYCEGNRYFMSPEDEWIYLFTHFAKHYRDGGIGLRHVTDLWIWKRKHPDMDRAYIENVIKTLQLEDFYGNILRLLEMWFEDGEADAVSDIITEFIFSSGSFGQDEIRVLSRAVRDAKHSALGSNGRLLYLWQTAFPDVQTLQDKYKLLKKAPWMLPAVWIIRPFYKVLFEKKSLDRKKKHLSALTEENLELHQQMLQLIGLDYHF